MKNKHKKKENHSIALKKCLEPEVWFSQLTDLTNRMNLMNGTELAQKLTANQTKWDGPRPSLHDYINSMVEIDDAIIEDGEGDEIDLTPNAEAGEEDSETITDEHKKEILEAYDYAMNGKPVAKLTGKEFQKDNVPLTKKVTQYYKEKYNGIVVHPELGEVRLDLEGVKDSLGHGIGRIKAAAYAAVPQLIKKGKIFDRQKNWKGRGYDTVVMIAPLEIGRVPYVGEVVVEQRPNRQGFYLHEVEVKEKLADAFKTPTKGSASPVSKLIIAQLLAKVKPEIEKNPENSEKSEHRTDVTDVTDRTDTEKEPDISLSPVTDPEVLKKLDAEEKRGEYLTLYRAAQLRDGKLYPPMAGRINREWGNPIELGKWEQADEHPELIVKGNKFKLDKGNGSVIEAAYNPYIHSSPTPLNDQFSSAWKRPELVTLEIRVPKSELTSGYHAEHAKDAVGMHDWKAGVVQGKLSGTRQVMLSRWDKPVRIVPDSEVAQMIREMLDGTGVAIPENVVTPSLRVVIDFDRKRNESVINFYSNRKIENRAHQASSGITDSPVIINGQDEKVKSETEKSRKNPDHDNPTADEFRRRELP